MKIKASNSKRKVEVEVGKKLALLIQLILKFPALWFASSTTQQSAYCLLEAEWPVPNFPLYSTSFVSKWLSISVPVEGSQYYLHHKAFLQCIHLICLEQFLAHSKCAIDFSYHYLAMILTNSYFSLFFHTIYTLGNFLFSPKILVLRSFIFSLLTN